MKKLGISVRDVLFGAGLLLACALVLYTVYAPKNAAPAAPAQTPANSEAPAPVDADKALQIYVLDVGQGNCALLKSAAGKTMLIDSGDLDYAGAVARFLHKHGVEKLDMAVATHPHADHMGGMAVLLREFQPEQLILPAIDNDIEEYRAMLNAAEAIGAQLVHPAVEQAIPWDDAVTVTAFTPFMGVDEKVADRNEQSVVIHAAYGDTSMLFMGDAGYYAERVLIKLLPNSRLRANVLLVGHHGSSDATTPRFLHAVKPTYAVISCGAGNSYGHPHQSVLNLLEQQGVQVYRTDTQGDIQILMDGANIAVTAEKSE